MKTVYITPEDITLTSPEHAEIAQFIGFAVHSYMHTSADTSNYIYNSDSPVVLIRNAVVKKNCSHYVIPAGTEIHTDCLDIWEYFFLKQVLGIDIEGFNICTAIRDTCEYRSEEWKAYNELCFRLRFPGYFQVNPFK